MEGGNVECAPAEEMVITDTNAGGVPKGKCYSEGNPVFSCALEVKAEAPKQPTGDGSDWFQGYSEKPVSALYRTTNSNYGCKKPTVHTMPTTFHAKSQKFSECLGKCGMYRNHSLNCDMDKNIVPDH